MLRCAFGSALKATPVFTSTYKTYCKNYRACLDALRYFKERIPEFEPFVKVDCRPLLLLASSYDHRSDLTLITEMRSSRGVQGTRSRVFPHQADPEDMQVPTVASGMASSSFICMGAFCLRCGSSQELLNCTSDKHSDYEDLKTAIAVFEELAANIDNAKEVHSRPSSYASCRHLMVVL